MKDAKVELKLMQIMSEFQGMVFRNARFKERYIQGRDVVVLELLFSSKNDPSITRTAVFALDKEFTVDEHTEVVNQLLEEERND